MGASGDPFRSVEHPGARVSVFYRYGDVEVMVVEIGALGSLSDPCLWGQASWHLVVEGRARVEQGDRQWEILPSHSLRLPGTVPYRIVNPAGDRLRLLSIVAGAGSMADAEATPCRS